MDDKLRETVARIDENVRLLRREVTPLIRVSQINSLDIAMMKNDNKWKKSIYTAFFGLLGIVVGALAEFLRK